MTDVKELADRPAINECEIEVTPEMIEAGREVVSSRWLDFIDPKGSNIWGEVLTSTFRAMMEASR